MADFPPTDSDYEVNEILKKEVADYAKELENLLKGEFVSFLKLLENHSIEPVVSD